MISTEPLQIDFATQKKRRADRRFATTLARGLSVLRVFRESDNGLSNQEISERTCLPRSTVSRLTFTLSEMGYLVHSRRNERYRIGPAALVLGDVANASMPFLETAHPMMQRLAMDTETSVVMVVRDGEQMMFAKKWQPESQYAPWLEIGHRIPICRSASGVAYLASLREDEYQKLLHDLIEPGMYKTAECLDQARQLGKRQLSEVGFVQLPSSRHFEPNISSVATTFRSREFGGPVAVVCGTSQDGFPNHRLLEEVGPTLCERVQRLQASVAV